jgi:hypothetical protein
VFQLRDETSSSASSGLLPTWKAPPLMCSAPSPMYGPADRRPQIAPPSPPNADPSRSHCRCPMEEVMIAANDSGRKAQCFSYTAVFVMMFSGAFPTACEPARAARSPAEEAAFMESTRCGPEVNDSDLAPVLSGQAVQAVGPLYATVEAGKSGEESRLRGAVLTISALPGVTAEWLDRELECHGARVALGRATSTPEDPFWLPGSSVDIDVRPGKDGFVVGVAGYSPVDARQIFDRAQAFAKAKKAPSST